MFFYGVKLFTEWIAPYTCFSEIFFLDNPGNGGRLIGRRESRFISHIGCSIPLRAMLR